MATKPNEPEAELVLYNDTPIEAAKTNGTAKNLAISRLRKIDRKSLRSSAVSTDPSPGIVIGFLVGSYVRVVNFIETGIGTQKRARKPAATPNNVSVKPRDKTPKINVSTPLPCAILSTATEGQTTGTNHAASTVWVIL